MYEHQKHRIRASFRPRYDVAFMCTPQYTGLMCRRCFSMLPPLRLRGSIGLTGSFLMLARGTAGIERSWGIHLCSASCSLSCFGAATIETPTFTLHSHFAIGTTSGYVLFQWQSCSRKRSLKSLAFLDGPAPSANCTRAHCTLTCMCLWSLRNKRVFHSTQGADLHSFGLDAASHPPSHRSVVLEGHLSSVSLLGAAITPF